MSGLFVAFGVLVADRERAATGRGQVIDVALYESIFRILDSLAITHSVTGAVRERMGTSTALAAPHNHYPTKEVAGSPSPVRTTGFSGASPTSWARAS